MSRARSACMAFSSFSQPSVCLQDLGSSDVRRHDDAIVHPLAFPPGRDDPGAAEVRQMPGNLRLRTAEDLHEVADTNLLVAHQVQQPEPRVVAESLKEPFHVVRLFCRHTFMYTH